MEIIEEGIAMNEEKDICVLCGCETPYNKEDHIDRRYHYVEGAGQLCKECYDHCEALRYYTSPWELSQK